MGQGLGKGFYTIGSGIRARRRAGSRNLTARLRARFGLAGISLLLALAPSGFGARQASADSLTVFAIPPVPNLLWNEPRALMTSTILAGLFGSGHAIGHETVRLECAADGDRPALDVWAGMTSADDQEERKLLFEDRVAFGILFHNFRGRLQDRAEIEPDLEKMAIQQGPPGRDPMLRNRLATIRYLVSPAACRRMAQYLSEYAALGYGKSYGLPNRPRYGEGSGCSAFVTSVMEVGGLMTPELVGEWGRELLVPTPLIGVPSAGYQVSVLKIFVMPEGERWALPNEAHRPIFFYEPQKVYHWARNAEASIARDEELFKRYTRLVMVDGKARFLKPVSLLIDATLAPVPTEPIWLVD